MGALIKLELHKLWRQKSFYVCVGITALLGLVIYLIWAFTPIDYATVLSALLSGEEVPEKTSSGFAAMLSMLGGLSTYFPLLLGIVIATFIVIDYSQNTVKNVYARGFSRTALYFSKYVACLVILAVMYALIMLFSFIAGSIQFGVGSADGKYFALIAGQFLTAIAFASIEFALCITLKNMPGSIVLIIVLTVVIPNILNLIDLILLVRDQSFRISPFWVGSFLTDLSNAGLGWARYAGCTIGSAAYAAVFLTVGWLVNRKSEK